LEEKKEETANMGDEVILVRISHCAESPGGARKSSTHWLNGGKRKNEGTWAGDVL